ncbi:MAG TPA: DUF305 domain-containing protein [Gemmatimonadota bacterium]
MSAAGALAIIAAAACATTTQRSPAGNTRPAPAAVDQTTSSPAAQTEADSGRRDYTAADAHFVSGMILHHAQAVLIAGWAPTHDASESVRVLCERIVVGQRDEIAAFQRWLRDRGEPAPSGDPGDQTMPGMDHPMLMPGMLTPDQLAQLDGASGPEFDKLFLTLMIQHHQGAITMVNQLFSAQGAAQNGPVFRFAADINADQITEIDRMNKMLEVLNSGGDRP